jgi:putative endonuclease
MDSHQTWHVYILVSRSRVLYVGVTRNLLARIYQYRQGLVPGFTSKYRVNLLVYVEESDRAIEAYEREKQIKRWRREKKIALIESLNPEWRDLWDEMLRSGVRTDWAETGEIPPLRSG